MSDEIIIECPSCDSSLEIPVEFLGETLECPSCEAPIELPTAEEAGLVDEVEPEPEPEPAPAARTRRSSGGRKKTVRSGKSSRSRRGGDEEAEEDRGGRSGRGKKGRGGKKGKGGRSSRRGGDEVAEEFDGDVASLAAPMAKVAGWMKFLGILMIISGVPMVLGLVGILYIVIGMALMGSAKLFEKAERDNSAKAMKQGVAKLAGMFKLMAITTLVIIILYVLVIPFMLLPMILGARDRAMDIKAQADSMNATEMMGDAFDSAVEGAADGDDIDAATEPEDDGLGL